MTQKFCFRFLLHSDMKMSQGKSKTMPMQKTYMVVINIVKQCISYALYVTPRSLAISIVFTQFFKKNPDSLQHTKRQVELFEIHCFTMFITALCNSFVTKPRWPKNERVSIYTCANFQVAKEDWCVMGFFQVESNCFYN